MAPKELTKTQIAIISGTVGGAILVGGLVAILVITQKNSAPPSATAVVKPPLMADGSTVAVKTQVCAPVSSGYQGLVPCEKQSTCTGCMEYTGAENPYSCVAVTGGNNTLLPNGQLAQPMPVNYTVPENGRTCRGMGTFDPDTETCKCNPGFSGKQCEVYTLNVSTPGSYCLPSYANQCVSPTTDSVLMNANSGKGGQYTCACKPEYFGLFAQSTAGGVCDLPLACGGTAPQMDASQSAEVKYAVFKEFNNGVPVFESKAVKPNRLTSFNVGTEETCYVKTAKDITSQPFEVVNVASNADPTCKPELMSNLCTALVSDADITATYAVRGSNRPGDPLKTRVSPAFFPPVPPALQRCPNGFSGNNTPSSPCMKDGVALFLQPAKQTRCGDPFYDPFGETGEAFEGTGTWYASAFNDDGEWNGAFGCVNDLTSAQMKLGPNGTPSLVKDSAWYTVDKSGMMEEVDCLNQTTPWLSRADYDAATKKYTYADACAGTDCTAGRGSRRKAWDGYRDGALFDDKAKPWFASDAGQTFGGQCACDGVVYRTKQGVALPMAPEYLNRYAGKESWWECSADTCASATNPKAHLYKPVDAQDRAQTYPKCVCNQGAAVSADGKYTTQISYAPQNSLPTCIDDPCNPDGFKTEAEVACTTDQGCVGVCYAETCHYPLPADPVDCTFGGDETCTSGSNAKVKGKCVALSTIQPGNTSDKKVCIYEDAERASVGASCKLNRDCSYGKCVGFTNVGGEFQGVCSGGCACNKNTVQQYHASSPLGFRCVEKCQVNKCVGGTCVIDPDTGKQSCICDPCYTGELCEISKNASRKGQMCTASPENGAFWGLLSPEEQAAELAKYNQAVADGDYWTCCEEGSECKNGKCT